METAESDWKSTSFHFHFWTVVRTSPLLTKEGKGEGFSHERQARARARLIFVGVKYFIGDQESACKTLPVNNAWRLKAWGDDEAILRQNMQIGFYSVQVKHGQIVVLRLSAEKIAQYFQRVSTATYNIWRDAHKDASLITGSHRWPHYRE